MTRRKTTRKAEARERAAERIAAILADDSTPIFLRDVLTDMLIDLSNETNIDVCTPEVARVALPLMLAHTDKTRLRQTNGCLTSPKRDAYAAQYRAEREAKATADEFWEGTTVSDAPETDENEGEDVSSDLAPVVDLLCWQQSHARPINNLLFAERAESEATSKA
jgi:hypothetical protein